MVGLCSCLPCGRPAKKQATKTSGASLKQKSSVAEPPKTSEIDAYVKSGDGKVADCEVVKSESAKYDSMRGKSNMGSVTRLESYKLITPETKKLMRKLNKETVARMRTAFLECDSRGDGYITADELKV